MTASNAVRLFPALCPRCGYAMDSASEVNEKRTSKPRPNDFSVCLNCGGINLFNEELHPRLPHDGELEDYARRQPSSWAGVLRAQTMIQQQRKLLGPLPSQRGPRRGNA